MKNMSSRFKLLKVRHLDSCLEQEISEDSSRIAPNGFYTDRQEIPKNKGGLAKVKHNHETYLFE